MTFFDRIIHDYLVLFSMVNAVGNLPVFAELTRAYEKPQRNRIYRLAVLVGCCIVTVFAFFGTWMLQSLFEVDTAAFKIAGGIIVFTVAARGVLLGPRTGGSGRHHYENVAVFPLGFPFLAGPGTIVTTILLFQAGSDYAALIAVFLVYLSILPILHLAPLVERAVGRVGIMVVSRILYVFIAAKAVSFVLQGIRASLLS